MSNKAKPKDAAADQYQRFLDAAKKAEADETPGSFDRAFAKIDPKKKPEPKKAS